MTASAFEILGGLALFLLAMEMMTDGLKSFAGQQLKHLLGQWTRTPVHGLAAGVLITGVVQSSSAVTVATIGFVNAGLLNLTQSLGVVFGANVGTTMTGWLVSFVGFGFRIEAFAMPMLALGVALKLAATSSRYRALGKAIAGFALFFLGLALLKESLDGLTAGLGSDAFFARNYGLPVFILGGFLATLLTQSSSAALAMILTAAAGNLLTLESAAAAVIGANLGTTSTAAISVLKATANARRLALGHILFNAVTGLLAVMILPAMLWLVDWLADALELEANPALSLALFHTLFNVLGAVLMLPFTRQLSHYLSRLFRGREEDNAEPRYLDNTLVTTPDLARSATQLEMKRLFGMTAILLKASLEQPELPPAQLRSQAEAAQRLNDAIIDYISRVRTGSMSEEAVSTLATNVRTCRYLAEAASLAPDLLALRTDYRTGTPGALVSGIDRYLAAVRELVNSSANEQPPTDRTADEYQRLKSAVLAMMVQHTLPVATADQLLDALSAVKRLCDQWNKAVTLSAKVPFRPPGTETPPSAPVTETKE
ncbi:Na/Pi cotransporter family protein [Marinobacter confluentis]|uniref:Na/Pi cotransporter family protein n=1 Tax=Marinobacter confluentis TaxID=1697557 RepID=A0A4Z1BAI1_9GAMM|nr:Na/Pi symporter [Marinobacter confluentis]TGN38826.1 Na/Pi cotransporter family protein [Marinobacter confluentis]